jgi:hypothetical protein
MRLQNSATRWTNAAKKWCQHNARAALVVLLVDSRWTLTVSAWLLRKSGSGEVWPMALAQAGRDQ